MQDDISVGFRLSKLENSHEIIERDMRELANEMKQFSADTRSILLKLTEVVASNSRIEEKLTAQANEVNRTIQDIKRLHEKTAEHASKCERTTDRLDRIEASMKSFGERFEATRDEYKETKYKVASWSATVGLIVALVVNFVFSKFTGGN
jgi:chromosome segregation ATPase